MRHERLRTAQGDTKYDPTSVAQAAAGQDAVVSALGLGNVFIPNGFMARSMGNIIPALEQANVRRFVLMSSFGVGESIKEAPLLSAIAFRTLLAAVFADKLQAEEALRRSRLDWTIVRPVALTNGPLTGRYRAGEHLELHGLPTISRADVAHFMLGEVDAPRYQGKAVVLSS
jgi:uncharacterized protein YbjT (DUF2867 family)